MISSSRFGPINSAARPTWRQSIFRLPFPRFAAYSVETSGSTETAGIVERM